MKWPLNDFSLYVYWSAADRELLDSFTNQTNTLVTPRDTWQPIYFPTTHQKEEGNQSLLTTFYNIIHWLTQAPPSHHFKMAKGQGQGRGGLCPGLLWSVLWFFGLIIIGWPVGFFISWLYIFLLPFGACIEPIKGLCDTILSIVQFPYQFAENMVNMKPCCGG